MNDYDQGKEVEVYKKKVLLVMLGIAVFLLFTYVLIVILKY